MNKKETTNGTTLNRAIFFYCVNSIFIIFDAKAGMEWNEVRHKLGRVVDMIIWFVCLLFFSLSKDLVAISFFILS